MAEVLSPQRQTHVATASRQMPDRSKPRLPPTSVVIPETPANIRNGHLNLDVFSPVNQNGSFEFDRVIKSGEVYKRTRKTKQWKKFYLVLRPNLLSMYKNSSEDRLLKQTNLSDLTAVAYLKDPKGRREHMFGLFSPSRNYHLQASSDKEARDWVELIKQEARIDEEEDEMIFGSPVAEIDPYRSLSNALQDNGDQQPWEHERLGSSSPEPAEALQVARDGSRASGIRKQSVTNLEYSGNEHASLSDLSDSAGPSHISKRGSPTVSNPKLRSMSNANTAAKGLNTALQRPDMIARNTSHGSNINVEVDEERVIWHGYLLYLRSKGGVRQWKKLWAVLRPKNLAFYKNEEEYAASLIIPLSTILSAVEIDPVSRSKSHCMQIIVEEKSYRFCAPSEEALARWLGALKSQLAKKKEKEKENLARKPTVA